VLCRVQLGLPYIQYYYNSNCNCNSDINNTNEYKQEPQLMSLMSLMSLRLSSLGREPQPGLARLAISDISCAAATLHKPFLPARGKGRICPYPRGLVVSWSHINTSAHRQVGTSAGVQTHSYLSLFPISSCDSITASSCTSSSDGFFPACNGCQYADGAWYRYAREAVQVPPVTGHRYTTRYVHNTLQTLYDHKTDELYDGYSYNS
jgi:hypothetical protein